MKKPLSTEQVMIQRLDRIIELLEDLFILHATTAGIKSAELRKIRGVAMGRVTRITKQLGN
jgi:hypothetical protein